MAVLRATLLVAIATSGCYEPEFRECVVTCADDSDCGPGQVCGEDRLCLGADARRCDPPMLVDASLASPDAPPRDAAMPPPDAPPPPPPRYPLVVKVSGGGKVLVPGFAPCGGECTYHVLGGTIALQASADEDWYLDKWTEACAGMVGTTCTLFVAAPITAGAKFRDDD